MITLLVFMVALFGLISLQRAAVDGAKKGKHHTAAVNIARFFMTQLQSEVSGWPQLGAGTVPAADNLFSAGSGFNLLNGAAKIVQNDDRSWFAVDSAQEGNAGSLVVDAYLGHSALVESDEQNTSASRFCVNYRIEQLDHPADIWTSTPEPAEVNDGAVWKVRVLVAWPKRNQFQFWANDKPCSSTNVTNWLGSVTPPDVVELVGVATREFAR